MNSPIFIVGCPHSGTSIMLSLLGHHPNIYPVPGESRLFMESTNSWLHTTAKIEGWRKATVEAGCSRWAEKTARHIYHLDNLRQWFPHAKIIAMLRDGRDVFSSHMERGLKHEESLTLWKTACRIIIEECLFVVRYERLIEQPEATLRDVCKYLGEDYVPEMIEQQGQVSRDWYVGPDQYANLEFRAHRNAQINQPLFDGRGRWKRDGYTLEQFDKGAKHLLFAMGYT